MTWEIVIGVATFLGFLVTAVKTIIPLTNAVNTADRSDCVRHWKGG